MKSPLLTIVIPTFNRADKLKNQLETVLWQVTNLPPDCLVNVVVLDNASLDATEQIVREQLPDHPWLTYVRNQTNLGLIGNYLKAINISTGIFVWVLGDDDPIQSDILVCIAECLNQNPDINLLVLNFGQINGITNRRYCETFYPAEAAARTYRNGDLHSTLKQFDHSPWLWISGNILKAELAREIAKPLQKANNLVVPFILNISLAASGTWHVSDFCKICMVTHTTSWAKKYYRRVYGTEFPLALEYLKKARIDLWYLAQFDKIRQTRWKLRLGDIRRRGTSALFDFWRCRL